MDKQLRFLPPLKITVLVLEFRWGVKRMELALEASMCITNIMYPDALNMVVLVGSAGERVMGYAGRSDLFGYTAVSAFYQF